MIIKSVQVAAKSPLVAVVGLTTGFFAALLAPAWWAFVVEQYDNLRPVITNWTITAVEVQGDDVILSGTMHKTRDCLLLPPPIARDASGKPYNIETPMWRPKDASTALQPFGPWIIQGAVGKQLTFSMVYMCRGNAPTIVHVGALKQ